jgi:N-acetylmuramoyl-L-alanine amidase
MILISAGHSPKEKGACFDNFCEYDEALLWAINIVRELEYMDIKSRIVPTGSLGKKVRFINKQSDAIAAIEVHFNSAMRNGKHVGQGTETLYCPGSINGKILAGAIQKYLWPLFSYDRGIKEGWYRMDRPGHKDYPGDIDGDEKPDYFLKYTKCPAIIIEPEFIHHKDFIVKKRVPASRQIAYGIIEGLEKIEHERKKDRDKKST